MTTLWVLYFYSSSSSWNYFCSVSLLFELCKPTAIVKVAFLYCAYPIHVSMACNLIAFINICQLFKQLYLLFWIFEVFPSFFLFPQLLLLSFHSWIGISPSPFIFHLSTKPCSPCLPFLLSPLFPSLGSSSFAFSCHAPSSSHSLSFLPYVLSSFHYCRFTRTSSEVLLILDTKKALNMSQGKVMVESSTTNECCISTHIFTCSRNQFSELSFIWYLHLSDFLVIVSFVISRKKSL